MAILTSPALYTVEIRDQFGRLVIVITRPQQKQFSLYRNKPGSAQFVLDLYDPQALPQYLVNSVNQIVFRRNQVPVFAGMLMYHEPKVDDSDTQKEVDITATGYFDLLDYRMITTDFPGFDALHNKLPFPPTDIGEIAWTLIDYAQFPVPNADDTTQSTVAIDGVISVQQSFLAPGTSNLRQLKFVIQNGSLFQGRVGSATSNTLTDNSASWTPNAFVGGTIVINSGTDSGDSQIIASNTSNTVTLYGSSPIVSGTATSATANTLTDTSKSFTPGALVGGSIELTGGTDAGDSAIIIANTSNTVTISTTWGVVPDNTTTYNISKSLNNGGVTSVTGSTLTDTNQSWLTNALVGKTISITAGTDSNDAAEIIANTSNTVTISGTWLVDPDTTSTYQITPELNGNWALTPDTTSTYQITPATPLTTGNLTVQLINDLNGLPKGTVIPNSFQSIPLTSVPSSLSWFEVDYSSGPNVSLIEGQKYWLSLALDTVQTPGNTVNVQVLNTDFYPLGMAYSLQNPALFTPDEDLQFFVLMNDNSYTMTKNTYLDIEKGTIQQSFRLAPTFDQYKHIKAAIEDMSTTYNGIDFAINVTIDPVTNFMSKFFNVYYPSIGVINTSLPFTYPGNIKKIEKPKDGTTLINEVYMRGQGSGTAQLTTIVRDNESILTYGVRQVDQSEPDIPDLQTLTSQGQEYIRVNKDPSDLPAVFLDGNFPPALGAYGIGDLIQVSINDPRAPILNFSSQYKIEEIDVTVDDDGVEEIQLNCSPV